MLHLCFLQMHFYCEGCHGTVQTRVLVVTLSATYLLIINPSALLCPGLAGAEPALDREMCHWAWCWKPQGNFAGQREIRSLCTSQHPVPECLHVHRNPRCCLSSRVPSFVLDVFMQPRVHVAWLAQTCSNRCKCKYQLYSHRAVPSLTERHCRKSSIQFQGRVT